MSTEKGIQRRKEKNEANRSHKADSRKNQKGSAGKQKSILADVSNKPNLPKGKGSLRT